MNKSLKTFRIRLSGNEIKNEIWLDIPDFPTHQISDLGRVKNILSGNILMCSEAGNGYLKTIVTVDGKGKPLYPHKYVGELFLGYKYDGINVLDHLDENKFNNRKTNFKIVSKRQNARKSSVSELSSGVTSHANKFRARITFDKKTYVLGSFDDEESASHLYNEVFDKIEHMTDSKEIIKYIESIRVANGVKTTNVYPTGVEVGKNGKLRARIELDGSRKVVGSSFAEISDAVKCREDYIAENQLTHIAGNRYTSNKKADQIDRLYL
jgi:hypothetical protein